MFGEKKQYKDFTTLLLMIGLIGVGKWGKNLVREFYNLGVLKTVCDKDENVLEQQKAKYHEINIVTDFQQILNDTDISMVCISLPTNLHYEYGLKALQANKHLFIESPLTLDVEKAKTLNSIAKRQGLTLMIGHLLHYHGAILTIKEMIKNKSLGNIKYITCNKKNSGMYKTFENVLWSLAVNDISLILSLCGSDITNLTCTGKSFIQENNEDVVNLSFVSNDIYVNINADWCNPGRDQKLTIVGDKGIVVFDEVEKKVTLYLNYLDMDSDEPYIVRVKGINVPYDMTQPLKTECIHFIECCNNSNTPITDCDNAISVLNILTQCDEILRPSKKFIVHETSIVESKNIGKGTEISRWTYISKDAKIGENCKIGQCCEILGIIGNNCTIENNVTIGKDVIISDNSFVKSRILDIKKIEK